MSERLARLAELAVADLRGVGPRSSSALEALGITSVLDLLLHYPRRYDDRTSMSCIAELVEGGEVSVRAEVRRCAVRHLRGRRSMVEAILVDGSGPQLCVTFFNQPWRSRQLVEGADVVVHGRPATFRGGLQMTNPKLDVVSGALGRSPGGEPEGALVGVRSPAGARGGRQT